MKPNQKAVIYGLGTFLACVTSAIVAHYESEWYMFIAPAFFYSAFAVLTIME